VLDKLKAQIDVWRLSQRLCACSKRKNEEEREPDIYKISKKNFIGGTTWMLSVCRQKFPLDRAKGAPFPTLAIVSGKVVCNAHTDHSISGKKHFMKGIYLYTLLILLPFLLARVSSFCSSCEKVFTIPFQEASVVLVFDNLADLWLQEIIVLVGGRTFVLVGCHKMCAKTQGSNKVSGS
jgi:hypothetical protein